VRRKGRIDWSITLEFTGVDPGKVGKSHSTGTMDVLWGGALFHDWSDVRDSIVKYATDKNLEDFQSSIGFSGSPIVLHLWTSPVHSIEEVT